MIIIFLEEATSRILMLVAWDWVEAGRRIEAVWYLVVLWEDQGGQVHLSQILTVC